MGVFSSPSPRAPAPLPPLPTREDPAIDAAKEKQRLANKRRAGLPSTTFFGDGEDALGNSNVKRPTATAKLLSG